MDSQDRPKDLLTQFAGYNLCRTALTRDLVLNGLPRLEIAQVLHKAGVIDNKASLDLQLAFQEALANAIEHGNLELESEWREQFDSSGVDLFSQLKSERIKNPDFAERQVEISIKILKEALQVMIRDQGKGFSCKPKNPDTATQLHGRGLKIIHSSMDFVDYLDGGRCIVMKKNL